MKFSEMERRVYAVLRDEHKRFIKPEEVEDWLNEAQEQIADRTDALTYTITNDSVGAPQFVDGKLQLPSNFLDLGELTVDEADAPVKFMIGEQFRQYRRDQSYLAQSIGRIHQGYIEVYPAPDDGVAYELEYTRNGEDMRNPEDESELPYGLQMACVNFARYQAKLKEGELEEADRYFADYETALDRGANDGRRHEMPSSIGFEPGPFDEDGVHI